MSFTYDDILHLAKPSDGDQAWGDEVRANFDYIGEALAPKYVFHVSPNFTSGILGNGSATDRRHFDTIQAAIDAAEAKQATSHYANPYQVNVHPGIYNENLVFAKTCHIRGAGNNIGVTPSVIIKGTTTTASPLVTVTPPATGSINVTFSNVRFDNAYSTSNGTKITVPYWVDYQDTGPAATASYLGFDNCSLYGQTWGLNNHWDSGLKWRGKGTIWMNNCGIAFYDYGGGAGSTTGGVLNGLDIQGIFSDDANSSNDHSANLYLHNVGFENQYRGAGVPTLFQINNFVQGRITESGFYHPDGLLYYIGSLGTNRISGLNWDLAGADASSWGNVSNPTRRP